MAPKKTSTKKTVAFDDVAADPQIEDIEEVVAETVPQEEQVVTFVVAGPSGDEQPEGGDEDHEDEDHEDDDDEDDDDIDDLVATVGQMGQLLMTDEGEAITDVLAGIRDALDKQNKILYRGLQLLEQRR